MAFKQTDYFNGYGNFDFNEIIWKGFFKGIGDEGLEDFLCVENKGINTSVYSTKKNGSKAWGDTGVRFLKLRDDETRYREVWLTWFFKLKREPSECLRVFNAFINSVPSKDEQRRFRGFVIPSRKTSQYLEEISRFYNSLTIDEKRTDGQSNKGTECLAAGMYVLLSLILQNNKEVGDNEYAFRFCRPPGKFDPVPNWEPNMEKTTEAKYELKIPDQIPLAQKNYDFWSALHSHFPELENPEEVSETEDEDIWNGMVKEIMPAQIHRDRISISKEEILPCVTCSPDASVGVFLIEEVPVWNDGQWNVAVRLYKLPWVEEPAKSSVKGYGPPEASMRSICINREIFSDNVVFNGICLSIDKQSDRYFSESFSLLYDHYCGRADHDWDIAILRLNENGHIQRREVEQMMKNYGIQWHANQNDVQKQEITYVCKFKQEYLRYIFLDPLTTEEIPIKGWQDPITGEYLISITLQYPGRFAVMKFVKTLQDNQKANRLALEGYLHGLYGFEKDIREAETIMKRGALQDDPYMAFEFGALLKKNGLWRSAKNFLKIGADHEIAGSKFELAELLLSSEKSEDIQQARSLIDSLWKQGYRTYGVSRSIDLLNEH